MSVFTSETLFYRTLCKRVLIKTDLSLLHRCQAKLSFFCILGITAFILIYHFLNPWFLFLEQILQELFQARTNFHAWPTVEYSLSRTVENAFTLHSHLKVPGLPWHSVLSNRRLKFSAPGSISYYLFFPILFLCPSGYLLGDTWGSPPTEHLTQVRTDSFLCLFSKERWSQPRRLAVQWCHPAPEISSIRRWALILTVARQRLCLQAGRGRGRASEGLAGPAIPFKIFLETLPLSTYMWLARTKFQGHFTGRSLGVWVLF